MLRSHFFRWWRGGKRAQAAGPSDTTPSRLRQGRRLDLEELENRQVPATLDILGSAIPLALNGAAQTGAIDAAPTYYAFSVIESGRLIAEVAASDDADTRLTLLSAEGEILLQSDGQSPSNPNDLIDLHLPGGAGGAVYYLQVDGLKGTGDYALTASFTPAAPPFEPLPVGARPWDLTTADFNGDGIADLASANPFESSISIVLGRGDGTFSSPMKFATVAGAWEIVAADFNGDGRIDLATPGLYGATVSVLLGRGDGTFGSHVQFFAGTSPRSLAAADFDRDGVLDLAVANSGSALAILRGRGDGTFDAPVSLAGDSAYAVVVTGDFNGDGRLDIAAINNLSQHVSIWLAKDTVDGTTFSFAEPMLFAVGANANSLVTGDFNGDGRLDLAVANAASDNVSVLLGRGDGSFADQVLYGDCPGVFQVAAGDFNRDGRLDLATVNQTDGTISILVGRGDGTFHATAAFVAADRVLSLVAADFNGDGALDLAAGSLEPRNIAVFLGKGDTTFQPGPRLSPGSATYGVTAGDFNHDGHLDIAAASHGNTDLTVLLGRGDGTYLFHGRFPIGADGLDMVSGDFNGDGCVDVAIANLNAANILILNGCGDGTFGEPVPFALAGVPLALATGDFNGDGRLDLAASIPSRHSASVLLSRDDGSFDRVDLPVGIAPYKIVAGDFNGDGKLDLATANPASRDVSVLLGHGDGTFEGQLRLPMGAPVGLLAAGDFNGDGRTDLAVALAGAQASSMVSILLGQADGAFVKAGQVAADAGLDFLEAGDVDGDGRAELIVPRPASSQVLLYRWQPDGTFLAAGQWTVGAGAFNGTIVDLNGDGRLDLTTANQDSSVSVLVSRAGETFEDQVVLGIVSGPTSVVSADFDGDGWQDLATANPYTGAVEIRQALGDGLFREPVSFAAGDEPRVQTVGDFNRDGRPDLAVVDYFAGRVSILLGLGDGAFRAPLSFPVGRNPLALAAGDLNGDGLLDLLTANYGSNDVSLLLGRGDGTFRTAVNLAVGSGPSALVVADFNRDGRLDVAVSNYLSRDVSVFLGRGGDGTFGSAAPVALPYGSGSLVIGDFDRDGRIDLAAAHPVGRAISLLLGRGDGSFQPPREFTPAIAPSTLVAADFNGDGRLDLAAAAGASGQAVLAFGDGAGGFQLLAPFEIGSHPLALAATDLNGDRTPDLISANGLHEPLTILLGDGDGRFGSAEVVGAPIRNTPRVGDLNGDGLADIAILRRDGAILVRMGRAGSNAFDPPVVINPGPEFAARDFTFLSAYGRTYLLTLDVHGDTLSTYKCGYGGTFVRLGSLPVTGSLPSRLVAGDLNGDGLDDVVVAAPGSHELLVGLQTHGGTGFVAQRLDVGHSPSDIALLDFDGRNGLDIIAIDQFSGDVRIFLNDPVAPFAVEQRYRAGTGLYAVRDWEGEPTLYSQAMPVALATGQADPGDGLDLIVVNSGSNTVTVLLDNGLGGLWNPEAGLTLSTGVRPIAAVTGLFNADPYMDLAVLNAGSGDVCIFLGNSDGGYDRSPVHLSAGNMPGGLAVHDVNGDGRLDLLIGNQCGDLLTLLGNGDGTFQPYERAERGIALAVADLDGDGRDDFVFGNKAMDRVSVQYSERTTEFVRDRSDGLLAPGTVAVADLNDDGRPDLLVPNAGGNDVRVYLGVGNGAFDEARSFFVGTNPAGVTVRDVNSDGRLDLVVANSGSNDVSILLGQGAGSAWSLTPGPRLAAGIGPVATAVADIDDDEIVDLVVSNAQSNNVFVLAGLGGGFFNDRAPLILAAGATPRQVFVGAFDARPGLDLVTLNAGSRDLTFFSGFGVGTSVSTGGNGAVAALAADVNRDGASELIVANSDGRFAVFKGDSIGLQMTSVVPASLFNVSDLALGSTTNGTIEVHATLEGSETVFTLSFVTDAASVTAAASPPVERATADWTSQPVVELTSNSSLALEIVVTLFLGGVDEVSPTSSEDEAGATQASTGEIKTTLFEEDEDDQKGESGDGLERDLLIVGADETPVEDLLADTVEEPVAPEDVPFPSPFELFDRTGTQPAEGGHPDADRPRDGRSFQFTDAPLFATPDQQNIAAAHDQHDQVGAAWRNAIDLVLASEAGVTSSPDFPRDDPRIPNKSTRSALAPFVVCLAATYSHYVPRRSRKHRQPLPLPANEKRDQ